MTETPPEPPAPGTVWCVRFCRSWSPERIDQRFYLDRHQARTRADHLRDLGWDVALYATPADWTAVL